MTTRSSDISWARSKSAKQGTAVISPGSPLGQALMGKRAGTTVTYEAPSGQLAVEIVSVGD